MSKVDWNELAKNELFRAVIDPNDLAGIKNALIYRIQWNAIVRGLEANKVILDFGCGIGRFAQRLVRHGLKYYGVDTSIGMIESAKSLNASDKVEFIHSAGLPLPFREGYFDVCLSVGVLQYLLHQHDGKESQVISELARVLSPRGQLLIVEQASASGRSSGTVDASTTEADYIEALSAFFIVQRIEKIRCGRMTRLSSIYLRWARYLPFKDLAIKLLAKQETRQAFNADVDFLKDMDYYDICIREVKK